MKLFRLEYEEDTVYVKASCELLAIYTAIRELKTYERPFIYEVHQVDDYHKILNAKDIR